MSTNHRVPLDSPSSVAALTDQSGAAQTLVIDTERAAWLALDPPEATYLRRLRATATARQTPDGPDAAGREPPIEVHRRLVRAGFLTERPDLAVLDRYRQVRIHLTNRCDLTCTHGCMDSAVCSTPETDLNSWRRLLDELATRYSPIHLSFSGDEPLLSASLVPLLEHAKSLHGSMISTSVHTDGLLLRGVRLARLAPLLDMCVISLDGISAETHDLVRGQGAFRRSYRNLLGLAGIPFRKVLNIRVLRTNRDELLRGLRPFLAGLPFRTDVDLGTLVPEGRGSRVFDLALPADEVRETLAAISATLTASGGVDGSALWMGVPVRPRRSCDSGDTLTISSNGDVSTSRTPRSIRGNVFLDDAARLIDRVDRELALLRVDRLAAPRMSCSDRTTSPPTTTSSPGRHPDEPPPHPDARRR